ncbi:SDR family oxidoreductase [Gryllotalpicola reticulitermitis]|uniref:SDR family oxidoreductase n=1 Tax=Gryllotalpicola reticulitermitis TaxID=1184153 RepID=A0ABV8Q7F8_9MICO
MRVFVTGASGHIGSLVTAELVENGHEVFGLARSDASAERVAALGGTPVRASLADPERIAEAAAAADGVVHLAFIHDFANFAESVAAERAVIEAIADALDGSGKPFLPASGTMMLAYSPHEGIGTEDMRGDPSLTPNPRTGIENYVLDLTERGIRSAPLRFSPTVHGPTDLHGFIPVLIDVARANGYAGYVGDGDNRWPAVHNLDAAHLIVRGLEKAPGGMPLHAVGDEGIPFREIAEAIGRGAGVPTKSLTQEEASASMGFIGGFAAVDNATSSAKTQEVLDWKPTHPGLLEDLAEGFYFTR